MNPEFPPTFGESGDRERREVQPNKDVILLPSGSEIDMRDLGFTVDEPREMAVMDYPEVQESPFNTEVISISGNFALVRAFNNGVKSYAVVRGPFIEDPELALAAKEVSDLPPVSPDDTDKIRSAAAACQLAVFDDFQGYTYIHSKMGERRDWKGIGNGGFDDVGGEGHFNPRSKVAFRRLHVVVGNLSFEETNRVLQRVRYANVTTVTFNSTGQVLIAGAGYLARESIGNRPRNPSGFVIIMQRTPESLGVVKFLQDPNANEREKRRLLSAVFQGIEPNFPRVPGNVTGRDSFLDQEQVDFQVISRTAKIRARFKKTQLLGRPEELEEPVTFMVDNLEEAVLVANRFGKSGFGAKLRVVFNDGTASGREIDLSKVNGEVITGLAGAIEQKNIEGYSPTHRSVNAQIYSIHDLWPKMEVTPIISRLKLEGNVNFETWKLITVPLNNPQ